MTGQGSTGPRSSAWHDHDVAAAAEAWLSCPSDTTAYARLVQAVHRRHAWLNPPLPTDDEPAPDDVDVPSGDQPEILDAIGSDRPPQSVRDVLGAGDPAAVLDRLRGDTSI